MNLRATIEFMNLRTAEVLGSIISIGIALGGTDANAVSVFNRAFHHTQWSLTWAFIMILVSIWGISSAISRHVWLRLVAHFASLACCFTVADLFHSAGQHGPVFFTNCALCFFHATSAFMLTVVSRQKIKALSVDF